MVKDIMKGKSFLLLLYHAFFISSCCILGAQGFMVMLQDIYRQSRTYNNKPNHHVTIISKTEQLDYFARSAHHGSLEEESIDQNVMNYKDAYQLFQMDINSLEILTLQHQAHLHTKQTEIELLQIFQNAPEIQPLYLSIQNDIDLDQNLHSLPLPYRQFVFKVGPQCQNHMLKMTNRHPTLVARLLSNKKKLKSIAEVCSNYLAISQDESQKLFDRLPAGTSQRISRQRLRQLFNYLLAIGIYSTNDTSQDCSPAENNKRGNAHRCVIKMSRNELRQLITKFPQLLLYRYENIHSTILYLDSLNLGSNVGGSSSATLVKMILKRPSMLAHSVNAKLVPLVNFLRDELGTQSWKRIILQYPQVFQCSVSSLPLKLTTLEKTLCLQRPRADISSVVSGFPPVLWLSTENIYNKVIFLKKTLELDDEELRNILVVYPQILGLSVDQNLRPKIGFFLADVHNTHGLHDGCDNESYGENNISSCGVTNRGAGLTLQELRWMVSYQPSILGYSLDGRIQPRIQLLHENSIRFNYAPPYLMSLSDDKFRKWLNTQRSTWSIS